MRPGDKHTPPTDVHSPFYPAKGCYSSMDPDVLDSHVAEALDAGINVLVVSWWGRPDVEGTADTQGVNTDLAIPRIVAAAERSWTEAAKKKKKKEEEEEKHRCLVVRPRKSATRDA